MTTETLLVIKVLKEKVQIIKEQEIYFFGSTHSNLRNLISKALDQLDHIQRGGLINICYKMGENKKTKNVMELVIDYVISKW